MTGLWVKIYNFIGKRKSDECRLFADQTKLPTLRLYFQNVVKHIAVRAVLNWFQQNWLQVLESLEHLNRDRLLVAHISNKCHYIFVSNFSTVLFYKPDDTAAAVDYLTYILYYFMPYLYIMLSKIKFIRRQTCSLIGSNICSASVKARWVGIKYKTSEKDSFETKSLVTTKAWKQLVHC